MKDKISQVPNMKVDEILARTRNVASLVCLRFKIAVVVLALFSMIVNPFSPDNKESSRAFAMSFGGYCSRCGTQHVIPTTDEARQAAVDLRDRMIRSGRIDIDELPVEQQRRLLSLPSDRKDKGKNFDEIGKIASSHGNDKRNDDNSYFEMDLDPSLATDRLYERRGKMFGVLVCEANLDNSTTAAHNSTVLVSDSSSNDTDPSVSTIHRQGNVVILKAYAGKLAGRWNLPGWAPIIGRVPESIPEYQKLSAQITEWSVQIDKLSKEAADDDGTNVDRSAFVAQQIKELTTERVNFSNLSREELERYQILNNFRGLRMPIQQAFSKDPAKNLPGGTGTCAAPKLLSKATELQLKPTGICEIFVGATGGMSTTKGDGAFYDACESRCQQIAGHMLCGLEVGSEVGSEV